MCTAWKLRKLTLTHCWQNFCESNGFTKHIVEKYYKKRSRILRKKSTFLSVITTFKRVFYERSYQRVNFTKFFSVITFFSKFPHYAKQITKELIWRNIFCWGRTGVNFSFFHTVMRKFHYFSITLILREFDFWDSRMAKMRFDSWTIQRPRILICMNFSTFWRPKSIKLIQNGKTSI